MIYHDLSLYWHQWKQPPDVAADLIQATEAGGLPVSVKTRLGYSDVDDWRDWLTHVLKQDIANLTIHLRTRASELRNQLMSTKSTDEARALLDHFDQQQSNKTKMIRSCNLIDDPNRCCW